MRNARKVRPLARIAPWLCLSALAAGTVALATGCTSRGERPVRARDVPVVTRDVPSVLRNTVGSETSMLGIEPVLVSGYGLVVGLNGTGSRDIPAALRAHMDTEMSRMGIGRAGGAMPRVTPGELLDDPNTAVVLVQALVQLAAPEGTRFDVYVSGIPGTSTTSLERGLLWTTELRRGVANPGGPSIPPVARSYGPIYTSPFIGAVSAGSTEPGRATGVVLGGGVITAPEKIMLVMDNPSHARSRAIASAINARFPQRGDRVKTARGVNEEIIEVSVPLAYKDRIGEFSQLIRYLRIDQGFPDEWARRYCDALKESPEMSRDLSWALASVGDAALPFLRQMYNYSEIVPRLGALEAGARMGDVTARPHLEDIVNTGAPAYRADAIALLGRLGPDPKINRFLREQLDSDDLDLRIAAYDALEKRRDPAISILPIAGKFRVDTVPSRKPMVYVTKSKEPRIVLFGEALKLRQPVFASDPQQQFTVKWIDETSPLVIYREPRTGQSVRGSVSDDLLEFIVYLAHKTTPEEPAPGLDMTYGDVVGALHTLGQGDGLPGDFVSEDDRVALEALRTASSQAVAERPELSPDGALDDLPVPTGPMPHEPNLTDDPDRERRRRAYVVDVAPPPQAPAPSQRR